MLPVWGVWHVYVSVWRVYLCRACVVCVCVGAVYARVVPVGCVCVSVGRVCLCRACVVCV